MNKKKLLKERFGEEINTIASNVKYETVEQIPASICTKKMMIAKYSQGIY